MDPAHALLLRALGAGPVEVRARGASMRPLLASGDRVRLRLQPPRLGDVALVELEGRWVLHRLVRRRQGRWLVRGDARPAPDGWVAAQCVLAVATERRPRRRARPCRWQRLDHPLARLRGFVAPPAWRALRRLARRARGRRRSGS